MITAVIGTTESSSDGSTTLRPSTADSTEIAGRDHAVAEEQCGAEDAERGQHDRGPAAPRRCQPAQQGDQRHDAALAVVVGAHHQE